MDSVCSVEGCQKYPHYIEDPNNQYMSIPFRCRICRNQFCFHHYREIRNNIADIVAMCRQEDNCSVCDFLTDSMICQKCILLYTI